MPKVSVIIPVYGVEKYIERCARSLFEQTLDDIEFIFVDDCTNDRSFEVLESVLLDYPQRQMQVKIVRHNHNKGLPSARRSGIEVAEGDYLIHCDSDDWVNINMYQLMYEKAIESQADIVVCDYAKSDGQKIFFYKGSLHTGKEQFIRDCCSMKSSWALWNKLVRTSLLKNNIVFPTQNMGEDMALILQIIIKSNFIAYVPKQLYYYYINPKSISRDASEMNAIRTYNQLKDNTELVLDIFEREGMIEEYASCIVSLKWNVKTRLWPLVNNSNYRKMWSNTYSEINNKIIWNSNIKLFYKILYLLTLIRIFPYRENNNYKNL